MDSFCRVRQSSTAADVWGVDGWSYRKLDCIQRVGSDGGDSWVRAVRWVAFLTTPDGMVGKADGWDDASWMIKQIRRSVGILTRPAVGILTATQLATVRHGHGEDQ